MLSTLFIYSKSRALKASTGTVILAQQTIYAFSPGKDKVPCKNNLRSKVFLLMSCRKVRVSMVTCSGADSERWWSQGLGKGFLSSRVENGNEVENGDEVENGIGKKIGMGMRMEMGMGMGRGWSC